MQSLNIKSISQFPYTGNTSHISITLLLAVLNILIISIFVLPASAVAESAEDLYRQAELHYRNFSKSPALKKKEIEWLNCINQYERISRLYPKHMRAPASIYKAAQLNIIYADLSGKSQYKKHAGDLLSKLRNRYKQSIYSSKAQKLFKTMSVREADIELLADIKTKISLSVNRLADDITKSSAINKSSKKIRPKKLQIQKSQKQNPLLHINPDNNLLKKTDSLQNIQMQKAQKQKLLKHIDRNKDLINKPGLMQSKAVIPAGAQITSTGNNKQHSVKTPSIAFVPSGNIAKGDTLVSDIRFWSGREYTRLVIDLEQKRNYTHFLLKKDPTIGADFPRLCIDIQDSVAKQNLSEQNINDNFVVQARAGQLKPHTVRVVIDLKSFDNYKIFSLRGDPFRIVVDVWGKDYHESPPAGTADKSAAKSYTTAITTDNLQSSDIARQFALHVKTIVIDPGHGGRDPGAPGYYKGLWEKDVVLKISKKLQTVLKKRLQCSAFLTRSNDRKLTLEKRTAIANSRRADLFVSIHCNAARNRKLRGIETYFLNLAADKHAISVAARENATSEKNISDLDYILNDLMKYAKIEESTRLANIVHKGFTAKMKKKYSDIRNLGVKQAPFYVLLGAKMPSILIETSFISNPTEAKRLKSDKYLQTIADSIAYGIEQYVATTNPKKISGNF